MRSIIGKYKGKTRLRQMHCFVNPVRMRSVPSVRCYLHHLQTSWAPGLRQRSCCALLIVRLINGRGEREGRLGGEHCSHRRELLMKSGNGLWSLYMRAWGWSAQALFIQSSPHYRIFSQIVHISWGFFIYPFYTCSKFLYSFIQPRIGEPEWLNHQSSSCSKTGLVTPLRGVIMTTWEI